MQPNERLDQVRVFLGLTQKEFAKRLFIVPSTYSQMKTGKHGISPRIRQILRQNYRVNDNWLMKGEGEMLLPRLDQNKPIVIEQKDYEDPLVIREKVKALEGYVNALVLDNERYKKIVDKFIR